MTVILRSFLPPASLPRAFPGFVGVDENATTVTPAPPVGTDSVIGMTVALGMAAFLPKWRVKIFGPGLSELKRELGRLETRKAEFAEDGLSTYSLDKRIEALKARIGAKRPPRRSFAMIAIFVGAGLGAGLAAKECSAPSATPPVPKTPDLPEAKSAAPSVAKNPDPPKADDPMRGWLRIQVGQPLRNPDDGRPTVSDEHKAFVLDGMAYLCPTRPVVTRPKAKMGSAARGNPWTVSIEDCRPAHDGPEEPLNRSYLREHREMTRPYSVVLGEPLTVPYSPEADDADSLPWLIRPHVDPAGNIYVVTGESEDDRLYCPQIPDIRFTGTRMVLYGHRMYTVNNYSIGTNICTAQFSVDRSRKAESEYKREGERVEISVLLIKNILLYAAALLMNLTLFSFLKREPE